MPVPDTISSIKSKLRKKLTDLFIFFRFSGDIVAFHIPIFLSPCFVPSVSQWFLYLNFNLTKL